MILTRRAKLSPDFMRITALAMLIVFGSVAQTVMPQSHAVDFDRQHYSDGSYGKGRVQHQRGKHQEGHQQEYHTHAHKRASGLSAAVPKGPASVQHAGQWQDTNSLKIGLI